MEFPGVLEKEHVEIPGGQLKKKWNFHESCLGFRPWNFQGVSYKLACRISRGESLYYLEFPGVK